MPLLRMVAGCLLMLALTGPSRADTTINVRLWDKDGMMDMSSRLGMGMHGNMSMATMGIELDRAEVPAGKVSFAVTNVSKDVIHEMLVAPISGANVTLPYIADQNRVDEEATGDLGEVSELEPGKSGELTLDLKPGRYVLYCNVPGHFTVGMWTTIVVK